MRILLDHELLPVREAQRILQVSRCAINEMIESGRLSAIKIGSQWKIEGWSLKNLLSNNYQLNAFDDNYNNNDEDCFVDASDSEIMMIAEWT